MSLLHALLCNLSNALGSVTNGSEALNHCSFATCYSGFDFVGNWQQSLESSEDYRSCGR